MSKKLLMDNYSNNGLMPVMDGLICWLDANDYDGTNILKDRSGNGNDFILNGQFEYVDGFLIFDSKKTNYADNTTMELDWNSTSIQIRVSDVQNYDSYVFSIGGWNGFNVRYCYQPKSLTSNKYGGRNTPTNSVDLSKSDSIIYASYSPDKMFLKCDGMEDIEIDTLNNGNKIFNGIRIGCTAVAVTLLITMKFGSILIYNRVLSEEEIKQNYEYEKSIERG